LRLNAYQNLLKNRAANDIQELDPIDWTLNAISHSLPTWPIALGIPFGEFESPTYLYSSQS
jgi:hypothetical protein